MKMAYNREIRNFAPLPSGPLPTQQEIDTIARSARRGGTQNVFESIRKVFQS
jgi:hypothetical protein